MQRDLCRIFRARRAPTGYVSVERRGAVRGGCDMTSNRDAISDRVGAYGHTPLQEPLPPERHRRRSIRLKGYDYSQAGAYFITICTLNRECLFGDVIDSEMRLNDAGRILRDPLVYLLMISDIYKISEIFEQDHLLMEV
jgi:hypothetical protein